MGRSNPSNDPFPIWGALFIWRQLKLEPNLSRLGFHILNWNTSYFQSKSFGVFSGCLTHNIMSQVESFIETWIRVEARTRSCDTGRIIGSQIWQSNQFKSSVVSRGTLMQQHPFRRMVSPVPKYAVENVPKISPCSIRSQTGESCYAWLRRRRRIRDDMPKHSVKRGVSRQGLFVGSAQYRQTHILTSMLLSATIALFSWQGPAYLLVTNGSLPHFFTVRCRFFESSRILQN